MLIMKEMKRKLDNQVIGFVLGVLAPLIAFLIFLHYAYPHELADESLRKMWLRIAAPNVISIAALPNLALFFLFIYINMLRAARGVLGATVVLAIVVLIVKFGS